MTRWRSSNRTRLGSNRSRLLDVIAAIFGIGAPRASYSVMMPLAAAGVVIAVVWPVMTWVERYLPSVLGKPRRSRRRPLSSLGSPWRRNFAPRRSAESSMQREEAAMADAGQPLRSRRRSAIVALADREAEPPVDPGVVHAAYRSGLRRSRRNGIRSRHCGLGAPVSSVKRSMPLLSMISLPSGPGWRP